MELAVIHNVKTELEGALSKLGDAESLLKVMRGGVEVDCIAQDMRATITHINRALSGFKTLDLPPKIDYAPGDWVVTLGHDAPSIFVVDSVDRGVARLRKLTSYSIIYRTHYANRLVKLAESEQIKAWEVPALEQTIHEQELALQKVLPRITQDLARTTVVARMRSDLCSYQLREQERKVVGF